MDTLDEFVMAARAGKQAVLPSSYVRDIKMSKDGTKVFARRGEGDWANAGCSGESRSGQTFILRPIVPLPIKKRKREEYDDDDDDGDEATCSKKMRKDAAIETAVRENIFGACRMAINKHYSCSICGKCRPLQITAPRCFYCNERTCDHSTFHRSFKVLQLMKTLETFKKNQQWRPFRRTKAFPRVAAIVKPMAHNYIVID